MFWIKVGISALLIAGSSEAAKRLPWVGAILVSLPFTSILSISWLYFDTKDIKSVIQFSNGIFWAVLPSLLLFLTLSLLLKRGFSFPAGLGISCVVMFFGYWIYAKTLGKLLGIETV